MTVSLIEYLKKQTELLREEGLYKEERSIITAQGSRIKTDKGSFINLCANDYLGLASDPRVLEVASKASTTWGYGMASVRFICGTQKQHQDLETELSQFLQTEDTILYSSCFDANTGLFETILAEEDAIFSDSLNHASIIDGIRLCKAKRFRYRNNDLAHLEELLKEASHENRFKLIATDGVFSMDGTLARLPQIIELAKKYNALTMLDDSHAVGVLGRNGKGTAEHYHLLGKIDIITGTLGKALGGASGGYVSGRKEIITWLRQRSRPYLFSNSLSPIVVASSLAVLKLIQKDCSLIQRLQEKAKYFRSEVSRLGFQVPDGFHPITPLMIGDAKKAQEFAKRLYQEGLYVVGFFYPVVPKGQARIRTQISAALSDEDLESALKTFKKVGKECKLI